MREFFEEFNFHGKSLMHIEKANEIIVEYQRIGLTLTLRQLYYQFVSRDIIPNNQKSYDNLGRLISNARLAGMIDWDAIEDRTRFLRGRNNWDNPNEMLTSAAHTYSIDMWIGQPTRVEVWIEKDALVGVIERVCRTNDVDYFACRGYVSQSELYEAGKRIERFRNEGQDTVVIHLGDHDPSGIDMTRDNEERLTMFAGGAPVEVLRVALNWDQVKEHNPPPNPAKMTDSRFAEYVKNFGKECWELDALEPRYIQKLVQDSIDEFKDSEAWQVRLDLLAKHQDFLARVVDMSENINE